MAAENKAITINLITISLITISLSRAGFRRRSATPSAPDDGPLLLAECKWSKKPVDLDVLERLVAKTAVVSKDLPNPPTRVDYALFSRSGFSERLREGAESRGVLLFTVDDVLGVGSEVEG